MQMSASLSQYNRLSAFLHALAAEVRRAPSLPALEEALAARGYGAVWRAAHVRPPADADLHLHTNVSDGVMSPAEVIRAAAVLGLKAAGIVDHDSVDGLAEAHAEAQLTGLAFWPGLEFSTGRPGCEILLYWPCADKALSFLADPAAERLHRYLETVQARVHADAEAVIGPVNDFLRSLDPGKERTVSLADLDRWYRGRLPYYPGTLCVLALALLTPEERERTGIHDPRQFNTAVVTPALGRRAPADRLAEVLEMVACLRRTRPPCLAVLAHPRELLTKGGMTPAALEEFVLSLAGPDGLDGLEVNNSRDGEKDTEAWLGLLAHVNENRAAQGLRPWLGFSHSSDAHVLAPGTATGELTIGYGLLDERPAHRGGNLRPQKSWAAFAAEVEAALA